MKQIPLTQGKVALVDDEDYEELSKYKWYAYYSPETKSYYVCRYAGGGRTNKVVIRMHRQIMKTPKGMICDHINHNTLDNRKSNLRNVTKQQNNTNKSIQTNNKVGEKNITFREDNKKFRVSIVFGRKRVFHGHFDTLEEAIQARDEALKKYHGEFANTGK